MSQQLLPAPLSNLIHLAPLQLVDLPDHPDLPRPGPDRGSTARTARDLSRERHDRSSRERDLSRGQPNRPSGDGIPDLLTFVTALLNDGTAFLDPSNFSHRFKHHSTKQSPPAAAPVEILEHSIPVSAIRQVQWSQPTPGSNVPAPKSSSPPSIPHISRTTPPCSSLGSEHWFARRSVHKDISSKDPKRPGHASWAEFVYGLRDDHSKHEADFTPSLYDARCVVDWTDALHDSEVEETLKGKGYTACNMGVYEMCHAIPPPLKPRCFCVLVVTASTKKHHDLDITNTNQDSHTTSETQDLHIAQDLSTTKNTQELDSSATDKNTGSGPSRNSNTTHIDEPTDEDDDCFIAITVPVDLTSTPNAAATAFYTTGRNVRDGETPQQRKRVVMGAYAAVETVRRRRANPKSTAASATNSNPQAEESAEPEAKIEWIMATASDAKGNVPLWMQKMSVPGAVAKDVGYFIKWIRGVNADEIERRRQRQQ